MLDLALATRLLEAVPASARIILLGDKDQLVGGRVGRGVRRAQRRPDAERRHAASDLAALCGIAGRAHRAAGAGAAPARCATAWSGSRRTSASPRTRASAGWPRDINGGDAPTDALAWLRAGADAARALAGRRRRAAGSRDRCSGSSTAMPAYLDGRARRPDDRAARHRGLRPLPRAVRRARRAARRRRHQRAGDAQHVREALRPCRSTRGRRRSRLVCRAAR